LKIKHDQRRPFMLETPQVVQTDRQVTAVIHLTIPRNEIQSVMGPAIAEVMAAVSAQGTGPIGPVFSHHFKMNPDVFDFEVGVPVMTSVTAIGRVKPSELPAAVVARTNYRGPYEGLGAAWGEFCDWIGASGLKPAPDLWERYLSGPESSADPTTWCTELNQPLVATEGQPR
jgi:effector-binding domain-containing protein